MRSKKNNHWEWGESSYPETIRQDQDHTRVSRGMRSTVRFHTTQAQPETLYRQSTADAAAASALPAPQCRLSVKLDRVEIQIAGHPYLVFLLISFRVQRSE